MTLHKITACLTGLVPSMYAFQCLTGKVDNHNTMCARVETDTELLYRYPAAS